MTCTKDRHVYEASSSHEFNLVTVDGHPYGSEGKHTCLCGKKYKKAPDLRHFPKIQKGSMALKIFKQYEPIDSYKPKLIMP